MFRMFCNNKECHKETEPRLDLTTNDARCEFCNEPVNVTQFVKVQLKAAGQVMQTKKNKEPFAFKCHSCGVTKKPVQSKVGFCCQNCNTELKLAKPFEQMLTEHLKAKP